MNKNYLQAALPAAVLLALTGCIDDKYDLSDIDTTTQLKVNDLVIPINISEITLDNIIDVDPEDPDATIIIQKIGDQDFYAVKKGGSFSAEAKSIKTVKAPAPENIEGTEQVLNGVPRTIENAPGRRLPGSTAMAYEITPETTTFTYHVGQRDRVDEAISSVKWAHMSSDDPLLIEISLTSPDILNTARSITFRDLVLTTPPGMVLHYGDIRSANGRIHIPELTSDTNKASVTLVCSEIDFSLNPGYDPQKGIIIADGQFDFNDEIGVESGELLVFPKTDITLVPPTIHFTSDYELSSFTVDKFSGNIDYEVDMDPISPVDMTDLPDFLDDPRTSLRIVNPQISLNVTNPVGVYGVGCKSGLTLTAMRGDIVGNSPQLAEFTVTPGTAGPCAFLLAPDPDNAVQLTGFNNPEKITYPGLGSLLEGNGIPDRLDINMSSSTVAAPTIFGDAVEFPLGEDLTTVEGSYTFYTPLALADGSTIIYQKTQDGWSNEDVEALVIETFKVQATAKTDLPCAVRLKARPVANDTNGTHISIDNPEEAQTSIPAMADDVPFEIVMKGDIRNLDGIWFEAEATDFNGNALSPTQTIRLNNIKVTVTGTYTKEL